MAGPQQQPQQQTHKAKLTAAGCPDPTAASIASKLPAGVNPDHVAQLARLGGSFNWQAFDSAIAQYGPQIIGVILSLFGVGGAQAQQP